MKNYSSFAVAILIASSYCSYAQDGSLSASGIDLGRLHLESHVGTSVAYDDRVVYDGVARSADADVYSDIEAGTTFYNQPALLNLTGHALYGYRSYNDYSVMDDDYYSLGAMIRCASGPWDMELGADWDKWLNYNTDYNVDTGQQPDAILTDQVNRRLTSHGSLSYDRYLSNRFSLEPGYTLVYYRREFEDGRDPEWLEHTGYLQLNAHRSEKVRYFLNMEGRYQDSYEEAGTIGYLNVGADGRATEKTYWAVQVGYAVADYEDSGQDQGYLARVRAGWQVSDKLDVYAFGNNDYQPAYRGASARRVYRAGYGAVWSVVERFRIEASVLHDYQEAVGGDNSGDASLGRVRHFANIGAAYEFSRFLRLSIGYAYANDQYPVDRQVASAMLQFIY